MIGPPRFQTPSTEAKAALMSSSGSPRGLKLASRPGTSLLGVKAVKWLMISLTGVTLDRWMPYPVHNLIKRESQTSGRVAKALVRTGIATKRNS